MKYDAREHARKVAFNLSEKDYAFTISTIGSDWDVYHFRTMGDKPGTLAFKIENEQVVISVFQSGHLTRVQAKAAVIASYEVGGEQRSSFVKGYVRNGVRVRGYYRGRR